MILLCFLLSFGADDSEPQPTSPKRELFGTKVPTSPLSPPPLINNELDKREMFGQKIPVKTSEAD